MRSSTTITSFLVTAIACLLVVVPSASASQVMTYRNCLTMVEDNPVAAFGAALQWRKDGGGPSAKHCMALAAMGQGEYAQAATLLEDAARDMSVKAGASSRVPILLSQSGNAWLMADEADNAFNMFDEALQHRGLGNGMHAELLIDRSRAHALKEDYQAALADLDAAFGLVGPRVELLVYRASAHRRLQHIDDAQLDIERAIKLDPQNAAALLERGNLKFSLGDVEDAHADWLQVNDIAPHSAAADAARAAMAEIDAALKRAQTTPQGPQDQSPAPGALVE